MIDVIACVFLFFFCSKVSADDDDCIGLTSQRRRLSTFLSAHPVESDRCISIPLSVCPHLFRHLRKSINPSLGPPLKQQRLLHPSTSTDSMPLPNQSDSLTLHHKMFLLSTTRNTTPPHEPQSISSTSEHKH